MPTYRAPTDTEVSTIVGGEEIRVSFGSAPREVKDEGLAAVLDGLADDPANPVRHAALKAKE